MAKKINKIEQLINQLCPNGVEFKKLGEVCCVLRGERLTKKELSSELSNDNQYPVFHGGLIPLGYYDKYNRKANQTMVINTGSVGEVVWSSVNFWSSDGTFTIETPNEIDDRFLYFFLKCKEVYLKTQKREGGVPTIDREVIKNLQIPIPPLPIQEEIVKILDTFTALEAELEAELEARKKQYEYYRNKLLTFGDEVEWKALGEIGEFYGGLTGKSKGDFQDGNVKYITYMNVFSNIAINTDINDYVKIGKDEKQNTVSYGDVLFTSSSETPDECGMSSVLTKKIDEPIYLNSFCFGFRFHEKDLFLPDFLKYLFRCEAIRKQINKTVNGVTRFNISKKSFAKIKIPVPPLAEQERIVSILDKFDALVNDLSQGLPAELQARRQQYEYYRNRLLNFDKWKIEN